MVRDYIVKAACVVLLLGFAAGIVGQVELLRPRILFLSPSLWSPILTLHGWATPVSLLVICLSTISLVANRTASRQWAVWLGFCVVPLLIGISTSVGLANVQSPENFQWDTAYLTANRHAFGTAALLVALGGLSARQTVRSENLSLKTSFVFAFFITSSGVALALLQAVLGLQGMPRQYLDYPDAFAQLQFFASTAAIACFILSATYVILLWRYSIKK